MQGTPPLHRHRLPCHPWHGT